jgi:hypothetical protein
LPVKLAGELHIVHTGKHLFHLRPHRSVTNQGQPPAAGFELPRCLRQQPVTFHLAALEHHGHADQLHQVRPACAVAGLAFHLPHQ